MSVQIRPSAFFIFQESLALPGTEDMVETQSNTQDWASVEFEASPDQEDIACWLLMQCGANGCEVKNAEKKQLLISGCFEKKGLTEKTMRSVVSHLEEYGLSNCLKSLRVAKVPNEDWLAKWKEGFEPFRVGTQFMVCPSWRADSLSQETLDRRCVIYIEPGMAFGTGLHTTTQFCLRALESYPPEGNVIDVGTGSGILAIACVLKNPKARVIAVDTDPQAIEMAQIDFELNDLEDKIDLRTGSLESVENEQFDLILSNLTCEDIVALLPDYVRMLKRGGRIIGAGVLLEKFPLLKNTVERYPLTIEYTEELGNWIGVVLQR